LLLAGAVPLNVGVLSFVGPSGSMAGAAGCVVLISTTSADDGLLTCPSLTRSSVDV
jgi:hypothetical protein